MPTAAELQILITARDEASRVLGQLSVEVQQAQRRMEAAGGGFGAGLAQRVSGVADAFRLVGGAAQAVGGVIGGIVDQIREGFASNTELERATIAFQRYTGSAQAAADIITALRREAAVSPFNDQEVIASGRTLIAFAQGSTERLLELVRVAERLAVLDPLQGLAGGAFALQEALSGDFQSLIDRFEIPRTLIQRLRDEGVPNLEIVKQALEFRGIDTGAIEAFGRSFEGRLSTIRSFGAELRQLVTAGPFRALGEVFGHLVELINRFGDQLRTVATAIGEVFVVLAQRAVQGLAPLLGFLDAVAPGLRELATAEFGRQLEDAGNAAQKAAPQLERVREALTLPRAREALRDAGDDLERLQTLAAQTAGPVATINRELGQIGVQAAEIQIGADRIRRGFEAQLRPLERQLDLLQNSADVQRIQNQLAANRALSERLQLTREIAALEAAGAGADPNAPDLTPRQQALAIALQERRLRLEGLDAERQRAPAIQELQQRIADLRRREQEALDPSERLLDNYRDRVAVLQVESQRWQNLKADIDAAAAAAEKAKTAISRGGADEPDQAAREQTARERGEAVAKAWLKGFDDWITAGGGTVWGAIGKSLSDWYTTNGQPLATRIGTDLGAALGKAASAAFEVAFGPQSAMLERLVSLVDRIEGIVTGSAEQRARQEIIDEARRRQIATLPRLSPEAQEPGRLLGGGAPPVPRGETGAGPGELTPGGGVTVTLAPGAVTVEAGGLTQEEAEEITRREAERLAARLAAAAAGTDPGPNQLLSGNVR